MSTGWLLTRLFRSARRTTVQKSFAVHPCPGGTRSRRSVLSTTLAIRLCRLESFQWVCRRRREGRKKKTILKRKVIAAGRSWSQLWVVHCFGSSLTSYIWFINNDNSFFTKITILNSLGDSNTSRSWTFQSSIYYGL